MDKLHIIERLLKEFGKPFYKMIPEKSDIEKADLIDKWKSEWKLPTTFNISKTYELQVALELNEKYPCHLQFFPNWNFMENFDGKWWSSTKWIVGKSRVQWDVWNALVIDLDFVESWFDTIELYRDYVINQLGSFMPSYVVMSDTWSKTCWWFHLVYIIDPAIRHNINQIYSTNDISRMLEFAHLKFKWGDKNKTRYWPAAGIRLPLSYHWKTWKPIQTIMFIPKPGLAFKDIIKHWIWDESDIDNIKYLNEELFNSRYENSKHYFASHKDHLELAKEYWTIKCSEIDKLPFPKVLEFLKDYEYDRTFSVKDASWNIININWHIDLDWVSLNIRDKISWALYPTNWYKLNKEENYVNSSFSWANHPTRPQGSVMNFLRYYFENNVAHLEKFLFKSFWIPFKDNNIQDNEDVIWSYNSPSNLFTITSTQNRVVRTKIFKVKKKETATHDTIIDWPLNILAKAKTNIDVNMMETNIQTTVYLVKNKNWQQVLLYPVASKRDWNRLYQTSIWFFFWDDNDVWMLFNALESIQDIPEKTLRTRWGYYDDWIYYLWNTIQWWKDDVIKMFPINEKMHQWKQVSFMEFLNSVRKVTDDNIAIASMFMVVGMLWMNCLDDVINISNIWPAVFISWETESGKSTLEELMMCCAWHIPSAKYRSTSCWRFSSTAKPFKEACTQPEIMRLLEHTWELNPIIKEGIRNVINREITERGTQSMKNIKYKYRSWLIISWEMNSAETSINNRTLPIYLKRSYQKRHFNKDWTEKLLIQEIKETTCYKDIMLSWDKYRKESWYILKAYQNAIKIFNKKWIDSRLANVLSYALIWNSIVYSGLSDDEVADALIWVYEESGVWNNRSAKLQKDAAFRLKELIMQEAIKKRVFVLKKVYDKSWKNVANIYEVVFQEQYINQYWPRIKDIIWEINEFMWEKVASLQSFTLLLKSTYENKKTYALDWIMSQILLAIRNHHAETITEDDFDYYWNCF